MPGFNPLSFSSISTISPENSCPGTLGYDAYAKVPLYVPRSLPQIPPYKIFKSTSPGLRIGFSCSLITTFPGSSIKIVFIFSSSVICCILCCIICCIQHNIRNILCQDIFILSLFFVYYAQIPLWGFINNNNKLSPFYFMYL